MPARPAPRAILQLYAAILRLHRAKLPAPMRDMGDKYVASEFRRHRDAAPPATDTQLAEFYKQWTSYRDMMAGSADQPSGQAMPENVLDELTPDQAARLQQLEREARRLGAEMLGAAAPPPPDEQR